MREHLDKSVIVVDRLRIRTIDRDCDDEPINKIKVETVGPPFKGNEVKIAEDGEILVKGENVMLGYWNNQIETDLFGIHMR